MRTLNKTICLILVLLLSGCGMSNHEYMLRKQQFENQSAYKAEYEPLSIEGKVTISIEDGGKIIVRAPSQPFREIPIPDGVKTQTELIQHLVNIGAISVIGWKALDDANGTRTTTINNNAGGQP